MRHFYTRLVVCAVIFVSGQSCGIRDTPDLPLAATEDSWVMTLDGPVPIAEVHTGQYVQGLDLATQDLGWVEVKAVATDTLPELKRIELENGASVQIDVDCSLFRLNDAQFVGAANLLAGDETVSLSESAELSTTYVRRIVTQALSNPARVRRLKVEPHQNIFVNGIVVGK
jgi:hypothetical protein